MAAKPDPEVLAKGKRRSFTAEYKSRVLAEADRCKHVLDSRHELAAPSHPRRPAGSGRASVGRVAVGAVRIGNAVGAAMANRRVLEPDEGRLALGAGAVSLVLAGLFACFPRVTA